jgi:hypothetical protein
MWVAARHVVRASVSASPRHAIGVFAVARLRVVPLLQTRALHRSVALRSAHPPVKEAPEEFDPRDKTGGKKIVWSELPGKTWRGLVWLSQGTWAIVREPKIVSAWWVEMKPKVMAELRHYWLGSKVLVAGMLIRSGIVLHVVTKFSVLGVWIVPSDGVLLIHPPCECVCAAVFPATGADRSSMYVCERSFG